MRRDLWEAHGLGIHSAQGKGGRAWRLPPLPRQVQEKVADGGSAPDPRSVLPPSIAEGGVRDAEVPLFLQDTENAQ